MTRQRDALAAHADAPLSVERLPTTLRLLFKGNEVEEIEARNIIWTKIVTLGEENVATLLGQRSNVVPVWAIVLIFKKPIIFKEIHFEDHGAGLPVPDVTGSNPRYAVIKFNSNFSSFQSVLVDIIVR
jgi:hypothetical protein